MRRRAAARVGAGLALSLLLHGAALGALVVAGLRTAEPEPRPIRVTLVPLPGEKPGRAAAAAPAPADVVRPAPPRTSANPVAPKVRTETSAERVEAARPALPAAAPPAVAAAPPGAANHAARASAASATAVAAGGLPGGKGEGAGAGSAADGHGGALRDRVARYVEEVRRRIAGQQRYPAAAKLRGVEGVVTVVLAIGRDGRLEHVVLEGDSNALLARSAREATEAAAPFAPPPGGARRIRVPVRYALR